DRKREVDADEHTLRDPLKAILEKVGLAMGQFQDQCEKQRQIEREMLLAQQKAEMDASAMELAEGLAENGQVEATDAVRAQAAKMQPEVNCESFAPHVTGTAKRVDWKFEIVDASLIPREYLCPDEKKIGAIVKGFKDATNIPGVRVFSQTKVGARV